MKKTLSRFDFCRFNIYSFVAAFFQQYKLLFGLRCGFNNFQLPFFSSFERGEHTAKDITLIASLTALAVVSRAVFYLVPQVKPIAAVVGVSGAVLGAKRGYLIGALSMFASNFYIRSRCVDSVSKWWLWQVWGFASVWCFAVLSLLKSHLQLSDFYQCLSFMGL